MYNIYMVEVKIKRGEQSWAYFPLAYNILLTIVVGLISILPNFYCGVFIKFSLIILSSILLFRLCFFNRSFRGIIVNIFSKSKDMEEITNVK